MTHVAVSSMSNAGGEGKTTLTLVIDAALDLMGRPPHLVDIDQGMGSLSIQKQGVRALDWNWDEVSADKVFQRVRTGDVAFDFGANMLASGAPVIRLYDQLMKDLGAIGHRRVVFVPISTNKPGAVGAASAIIRTFSHMECHPVLVNRDGSDNYDEDVTGLNALRLPFLDPSLQAFRQMIAQRGLSMADCVRTPPEGYVIATNFLATWIRDFATQPPVADFLGGDISPVLDSLGREMRPRLTMRGLRLEQLRDDRFSDLQRLGDLIAQIHTKGTWRLLAKHGVSPSGLRAAADELEAAT